MNKFRFTSLGNLVKLYSTHSFQNSLISLYESLTVRRHDKCCCLVFINSTGVRSASVDHPPACFSTSGTAC